ncbi:vWA-like protein [Ascoidea rubescens DSM 1968]|uniref:Protein transport protein SEC23 n=1 Tax=Ascoidea rubescens DSM 1968 TaxID=1344418 RepID=A0A1D2VBS6_9ASCO|nr:vWA-like protein [Ascoidea rubescens DSM 1968]ODV59012.1 vWA-like protein [Ascoidea rubescens DSM 1968]
MNFQEAEDLDGVRFSWNTFPTNTFDASNLVLPIGSLYTPLFKKKDLNIIDNQNPIVCSNSNCQSILNKYTHFDHNSLSWICSICLSRNFLPKNYFANSSADNNNINLNDFDQILTSSTIEYKLPNKTSKFPSNIYLFAIDLALNADQNDLEEFESLKSSILSSINYLSEDSIIGLITFGKNINIYQLSDLNIIKNFSFNGDKFYSKSQIQEKLGILPEDLRSHSKKYNIGSNYFQKISTYNFVFEKIINNLKLDVWPIKKNERKLRSTGNCLNIIKNLLISCFPQTNVQILLFLSGPADYGLGKITTPNRKDTLRSNNDIINGNKNFHKESKTFYNNIAKEIAYQGYTLNLFIGSYDQIGLFEMSKLLNLTSGSCIFSDSFKTSIFKNSLIKFFESHSLINNNNNDNDNDNDIDIDNNNNEITNIGFNGSLQIKTSVPLKINGLIGNAISLNSMENSNPNLRVDLSKKKNFSNSNISDLEIGIGKTNSWKLCNVSSSSTYAIYFEINKDALTQTRTQMVYIQYTFHYQHLDGQYRLRVTTIQRPIYKLSTYKNFFLENFDEEAAVILISRLISFKKFNSKNNDFEKNENGIKYIDEMLIDLIRKFNFIDINTNTLLLPGTFLSFPGFTYNLRRSFLLNSFNYSPDELTYYNHLLLSENVDNSLVMIQPVLLSYGQDTLDKDQNNFDNIKTEAVLLDSLSIKSNRILFLDTFFEILVFHGANIAALNSYLQREPDKFLEKYGNQFKENFDKFLKSPNEDIKDILVERFPLPRFISCKEGDSQSRFLISKLSPTNAYKDGGFRGEEVHLLTDDLSLQSYFAILVEKALTNDSKKS